MAEGGSKALEMLRARALEEKIVFGNHYMVPLTGLCRSANDAPLGAPN